MMKTVVRLVVVSLLLVAAVAGVGYYFVFWPNVRLTDEGILYIRRGDSFETVMAGLQHKGYIRNAYTLRKVAELKKYPERVKSGRYQLKKNMSNNELVNLLRSGRQAPVHFTFNNIRTLEQFAGVVNRQLDIDSAAFLQVAGDQAFIAGLGFTPETLPALFIPNTYQIYWDISARDFMKKMAAEYERFWNGARRQKAAAAGLSPTDVTILASIIEEETLLPEEYPIIAGVYINRLKRDIPLSACPTLKFAWGDFSLRRILKKHMEIESPYNTYKYKGLPPGPVRMPSVKVMEAVLNYQRHDYLYFCAKSDFSGGHHFSRTLRQHNEYARQYHQALNKRKIY